MPMSHDPNTYTDCKRVFELAVQRNGLKVRMESRAAAVRFRHRMYAFRKLLFKAAERASIIPGDIPANPYSHLVITLEDNIVVVKERDVPGDLMDLDDQPINIADTDPLLEAARNLKLRMEE